MPSQSSSKTQVEAGLKSQDKEKSPLVQGNTSTPARLKTGFKAFVQWVTSDSSTPVIREIIGTLSCMAVITYVSGYSFGTWVHSTKKQLINKINDTINRPL